MWQLHRSPVSWVCHCVSHEKKIQWVWKTVLQLYGILPSPPMSGFSQDVFSICVSNTDLENSFHRKNKIRIHPVSHGDKYEFGLAWTLMILARWGVFSLQSTIFYAGGRAGRSQTIKQCWSGKGKLWSLVGKGHHRALGQSKSQLLLPARNIFPPMWETCCTLAAWVPLTALYLLYNPPLWNSQDDDIHLLYSHEQNK